MKTIRLRPGIHYVPIEGGVYFSSARATFVVRGPDVLFRVVDTCLPLLEDGTDIDELVAAIGTPAARKMITSLVNTLDSRGLVLHLEHLRGPEPCATERQRFGDALAYLETHRDDPYADFRRIRSARVLLSGPAEALGPAARGLLRAGIGHVMAATDEPHRLSALAGRHSEIQLVLCHAEGIPDLVAGHLPDAAVIFTEDTFPTDALARLPVACLAIPVRLGKDLAIVGPAIGSHDDPSGAEKMWARAVTWCRRDDDDLLVRPSGDLLAGALAGQVALDALIGLNRGRIHLVHGSDLNSDAVTLTMGGSADLEAPIELGSARRDGPADLGWLESASQRWAGLFRVSVPGGLPQMPVSITLAEGRSEGFDGRVLGFGPDQEASTTEAGLEALRRHCSARAIGAEVGAAGRDETRWLLDGALRLLARQAGEARQLEALGIDDAEARRLWRALEEHELTPVRLGYSVVPGFGWVLLTVRDRPTGSRLAAGWGPTTGVAAVAALSAAIATVQVRRSVDAGFAAGSAYPGFLDHLHGAHVDRLAAEVRDFLGATGGRLTGRRLARDAVAGRLAAWCGTVGLDG